MDKAGPAGTAVLFAEEGIGADVWARDAEAAGPFMGVTYKEGDRVRVTPRSRVKGYEPGDRGYVVDGPRTLPDGTEPYYLVVMERDGWSRRVPFDADEIEADVRSEGGTPAEGVQP
jgi:hypothetical protein